MSPNKPPSLLAGDHLPLAYLRIVATTSSGRTRLANMLTAYLTVRRHLPEGVQRSRDLSALRIRHALREQAATGAAAPAPPTGQAA